MFKRLNSRSLRIHRGASVRLADEAEVGSGCKMGLDMTGVASSSIDTRPNRELRRLKGRSKTREHILDGSEIVPSLPTELRTWIVLVWIMKLDEGGTINKDEEGRYKTEHD